ncbi:hypothetical protein BHE74_00030689, partial [Ensete ventricosum]
CGLCPQSSPLRAGSHAGGWCLCDYLSCNRRLRSLCLRTTAMRGHHYVAVLSPRRDRDAQLLLVHDRRYEAMLQLSYPTTLHSYYR